MESEEDCGDVFKTMASFYESYTTKLLNRTIPFDEDKAISFVRGKNQELQNDTRQETPSPPSSPPPSGLNGEEVKEFYDHLIQSTSSNTHNTRHQPIAEEAPPTITPIDKPPQSCNSKRFSKFDMFKFVQEGNFESLREGLSHHDINMKDGFDWSLLMCASCAGHVTIVHYLLNNGALWRGVVDRCSLDAPMIAEKAGNFELAQFIRSFQPEERDEDEERTANKGTKRYYCEVCKMEVTDCDKEHKVSTLHQFSCQHKLNLHPYTLPEGNKGFQMMICNGWDPQTGLGTTGQGHRYPVKTVLKQDRLGIGVSSKSKIPRVTHFGSGDVNAVKNRYWRLQRERGSETKTRREREKDLRKERSWEVNMRLYMNSD